MADLWIKPRPTSDYALVFGLLKVIIDEGLYDKDFVDKWTVGFERLREHVTTFTLADVEKITWIPRQQIEQLARWYSELVPSIVQMGILSSFLCKYFIIPFFKEWQIITHFSYRV